MRISKNLKQQKLKNNALYIAFLFIGLLVCNCLPAQALDIMAENGETDESNAAIFIIQNEGDTFKFSQFSAGQKDSFSWQGTKEFTGIRVVRSNDSIRLIPNGTNNASTKEKDSKTGLISVIIFLMAFVFGYFLGKPKHNGYKH